jgi:hypothetical protein
MPADDLAMTKDRAAREREILEESWMALEEHVRERHWRGYDPDDALRSPLLGRLPGRWIRRSAASLARQLPFNPRAALLYRPISDPQSLSLFLRGYLRRAASERDKKKGAEAGYRVAETFALLRSQPTVRATGPFSWGYPFPWQGRRVRAEAYEPNSLCASFAGQAMLDLAEGRAPEGAPPIPRPRLLTGNLPEDGEDLRLQALKFAWQTAVHVLRLHPSLRTEEGLIFYFVSADREEVIHASLPLAAFVARMGRVAQRRAGTDLAAECEALAKRADDVETRHRLTRPWRGGSLASECWEAAANAALFAIRRQDPQGFWLAPGGAPGRPRRSVWSFQMGSNLVALKQLRSELWESRELARRLDDWKDRSRVEEFFVRLDHALAQGWQDYRARFFAPGQMVRFGEDLRGPLDSHAVARSALALAAFGEVEAGREQLIRLIAQMQDAREGIFYYQRNIRGKVNRVEYMRWTQAWVFWALAGLLAYTDAPGASVEPAREVAESRA